jgi:hypothetical protein
MDYDNLHAEMAEIDENIVKNELTVLENAEQLKRRKDIYEIIHPDATSYAAKVSRLKHVSSLGIECPTRNTDTFVKNTIKETGKAKRTINKYLEVGKNLTKPVIALLKGTVAENNLEELHALSKISDPERQKELVEKFISGEFKNIRAAIKFQKELNMPKHIDTTKPTVPSSAYKKILKEFLDAEHEIFLLKMEVIKLTKELNSYKQNIKGDQAA